MSDAPAKTPVEAVLARAVDGLIPGDELSIVTDVDSYRNLTKKPPVVLVAIARDGYAGVLAIDAAEFEANGGGVALALLAGWERSQGPTAMDRATTAALDARQSRR